MGPGTILESPFGVTEFLRTAVETDGELHEQRVVYRPDSPFPQTHFHPGQDERFIVEEGVMLFVLDGKEVPVGVGSEIEIPRGTRHKARNAQETETTTVLWQTRPALRTAEFFCTANALGRDTLGQTLLVSEYSDVFRLAGPTAWLVPPLATVARVLGKRLPG